MSSKVDTKILIEKIEIELKNNENKILCDERGSREMVYIHVKK